MVFKRTRLGPSMGEQTIMQSDPETNPASAALLSSYYGPWGAPGQGFVSFNKFMPGPGLVDTVAMPVLLFGVALFFLMR